MYVVVTRTADGALRDVVGPFWERQAGTVWARGNLTPRGLRWDVTEVKERGVWTAEQERGKP